MDGFIMNDWLWPAWLGGLFLGLLILLYFWLLGRPAGCSTGYGNVCGLLSRTPFFHQGEYRQLNNSRLWFLLGVPVGGGLSILTSGQPWHLSWNMGLYDQILPASEGARMLWWFLGGLLLGLGARMAGACTMGHAIVGSALRNPASLTAATLFFASAMLTTWGLFHL